MRYQYKLVTWLIVCHRTKTEWNGAHHLNLWFVWTQTNLVTGHDGVGEILLTGVKHQTKVSLVNGSE